jgi:dienelactone hydrolase
MPQAGFLLASLASLALMASAARAQPCGGGSPASHTGTERVELLALGAGQNARLSLPGAPGAAAALPAVLLVGDSLGWDPRQERYVSRLVAFGLAVLELTGEEAATHIDLGATVQRAAARLGCDSRIDPARIGVLGFGAGAAPLLPMNRARALLYPGCPGLRRSLAEAPARAAAGSGPVLLMHGTADLANPPEECAALAALLEEAGPVRHIAYRGAGYAWDMPMYGGPRAMLLQRPDAPGWLPVSAWPELTDASAEQVAQFFSLVLRARD